MVAYLICEPDIRFQSCQAIETDFSTGLLMSQANVIEIGVLMMTNRSLQLPPDAVDELSIELNRLDLPPLSLRRVMGYLVSIVVLVLIWHVMAGTHQLKCEAAPGGDVTCVSTSWFGLQRERYDHVVGFYGEKTNVEINDVPQITIFLNLAGGTQREMPGEWDERHEALGEWINLATKGDSASKTYLAPMRIFGFIVLLVMLFAFIYVVERFSAAKRRHCKGAATTMIQLVRICRASSRAVWLEQLWCDAYQLAHEEQTREASLHTVNEVGTLVSYDEDGDKKTELVLFTPTGFIGLGKAPDNSASRIASFLGLPRRDRERDSGGVFNPPLSTARGLG